jgi:hypothetical protein
MHICGMAEILQSFRCNLSVVSPVFCSCHTVSMQLCIQNVEENEEEWKDTARKCLSLCFKIFVSQHDGDGAQQELHDVSSGALSSDEVSESFFAPIERMLASGGDHEAVMEYQAVMEQWNNDSGQVLVTLTDSDMCSVHTPNLARACKLPP